MLYVFIFVLFLLEFKEYQTHNFIGENFYKNKKRKKKGFKQENLYIACSILIVRTFLYFVFHFSTQPFFKHYELNKIEKQERKKQSETTKGVDLKRGSQKKLHTQLIKFF